MIRNILFILKSCNLLVINLFLLQIGVWTLCRRGPLCTKLTRFHRYEVESTVKNFCKENGDTVYLKIILKNYFFHDENLVQGTVKELKTVNQFVYMCTQARIPYSDKINCDWIIYCVMDLIYLFLSTSKTAIFENKIEFGFEWRVKSRIIF